ncbi:MAG: serine--tRNA ligase [Xanthobacteraceae bacterium]
MHDIRFIRENPDAFDKALARRGLPPQAQRLIVLDEARRAAIQKAEAAQARRNAASKEIGDKKKRQDEAQAKELMAEIAALKDSLPQMEAEEKSASKTLNDALAEIPNSPLDEVPDGKDEKDNVEHHRFGAKRDYSFALKQHFELGEALGQMDFDAASKLSGARFVVLKKGLARLERALGQFFLDLHTSEHGYVEVNPPLMVLNGTMFGTAQLPKFQDDQFEVYGAFRQLQIQYDKRDVAFGERQKSLHLLQEVNEMLDGAMREAKERNIDVSWVAPTFRHFSTRFRNKQQEFQSLASEFGEYAKKFRELASQGGGQAWLIPTAEVPLTNLVRESIVDEAQLPMRLTACTPCFRAEAGAAGKDTRGMIRQHQFTKVELVSITTPEQSKDEHERMLSCAEEVLRRLDLHYRVITLCTGDMGFASQKTYDIEVWLPGQNAYREISSCSICGDFQARRMNARYRSKEGRHVRHVHTLNGSGVAVGRALIAVMETYQQEDGSIAVPAALLPYMGGLKKIEK